MIVDISTVVNTYSLRPLLYMTTHDLSFFAPSPSVVDTYSLRPLLYIDNKRSVFLCTKSFCTLHPYSRSMTTSLGKTDLSDSRQPQLYAAYSITYALAVTAVALRLSARKFFSKAGIWLDDYAICTSLVIASANFVDMIICKKLMTGAR